MKKVINILFVFLLIITIISIFFKFFTITTFYIDEPTSNLFFASNLNEYHDFQFFKGYHAKVEIFYEYINPKSKYIVGSENSFLYEPLYDFIVSYGWFTNCLLLLFSFIILLMTQLTKRKKIPNTNFNRNK